MMYGAPTDCSRVSWFESVRAGSHALDLHRIITTMRGGYDGARPAQIESFEGARRPRLPRPIRCIHAVRLRYNERF